jgi:uncharacterized protein YbjT (DUF2867 family)
MEQVYELTGPESLTVGDMVHVLGRALGKRIRYENVPAPLAAMWLRRMGLPAYVATSLVETLGALRRSEFAYVTDAVAQVGGIEPQHFETWCKANCAAYR